MVVLDGRWRWKGSGARVLMTVVGIFHALAISGIASEHCVLVHCCLSREDEESSLIKIMVMDSNNLLCKIWGEEPRLLDIFSHHDVPTRGIFWGKTMLFSVIHEGTPTMLRCIGHGSMRSSASAVAPALMTA